MTVTVPVPVSLPSSTVKVNCSTVPGVASMLASTTSSPPSIRALTPLPPPDRSPKVWSCASGSTTPAVRLMVRSASCGISNGSSVNDGAVLSVPSMVICTAPTLMSWVVGSALSATR